MGDAGPAPETSLSLVRRFRASPEAVFDACTDPAKLGRWFGPADFRVTHIEADARVGGRLAFRMEGPAGPVAAEGTFREVAPPRRVQLTWRWTEGPPEGPGRDVTSLVTFDIAPDGEGSRLTLTHEGFRDGPATKTHEEGWSEAADKLSRLLGG